MNGSYEAIACGGSAGGFEALCVLLQYLRHDFSLPIFVVLHTGQKQEDHIISLLSKHTSLRIKEAEENEMIQPCTIYLAPPNYHMLIEDDKTISLSAERKVCFARPSIDVLFESAADAYQSSCVGILLSGANSDGAKGIIAVKEQGGLALVQDPKSAKFDYMPKKALQHCVTNLVLDPMSIGKYLSTLV